MWVSALSCGTQLFPDGRHPHSVVHMEATNGTRYYVGWHNGQHMRMTGANQMVGFVRGTRVSTQKRLAYGQSRSYSGRRGVDVWRTDKADRIVAGGAWSGPSPIHLRVHKEGRGGDQTRRGASRIPRLAILINPGNEVRWALA